MKRGGSANIVLRWLCGGRHMQVNGSRYWSQGVRCRGYRHRDRRHQGGSEVTMKAAACWQVEVAVKQSVSKKKGQKIRGRNKLPAQPQMGTEVLRVKEVARLQQMMTAEQPRVQATL